MEEGEEGGGGGRGAGWGCSVLRAGRRSAEGSCRRGREAVWGGMAWHGSACFGTAWLRSAWLGSSRLSTARKRPM